MTTLPGGAFSFLAVTIVVFTILGCVLEGLPAILLLAPIMFPIAKKLGVHDIHYSMVVVTAMNIGLMLPPIGVGPSTKILTRQFSASRTMDWWVIYLR